MQGRFCLGVISPPTPDCGRTPEPRAPPRPPPCPSLFISFPLNAGALAVGASQAASSLSELRHSAHYGLMKTSSLTGSLSAPVAVKDHAGAALSAPGPGRRGRHSCVQIRVQQQAVPVFPKNTLQPPSPVLLLCQVGKISHYFNEKMFGTNQLGGKEDGIVWFSL
ncbi:unnamed protein product [Gadus morhua 'NCC']